MPGLHDGDILGHEFMGIVEDTGPGVTRLARGDRVVVPFVIACGACYFCTRSLFSACETSHPAQDGQGTPKTLRNGAALFGYSDRYGAMPGGQAEYVRVPFADTGPIRIPDALTDAQVLFLSDILPTGYQAALNAQTGPGRTLAIFGAGPVGLMAAASARMLGTERIFMVDPHPYRLQFAADTYGVEPVDPAKVDDPATWIVEQTQFRGVDASIDAVGFEAKGSLVDTVMTKLHVETSSGEVLRQCIAATRRGGVVSVPGVYAGLIHAFHFGDAFDKGLTFRMGQTHVQRYMPELLQFIAEGRLAPQAIVTHHLPLEEASRGYELFDRHLEDCRKVVLTPGGPQPAA